MSSVFRCVRGVEGSGKARSNESRREFVEVDFDENPADEPSPCRSDSEIDADFAWPTNVCELSGVRCLETVMLQLQCNYYKELGESESNASGRQSNPDATAVEWWRRSKINSPLALSTQKTDVLQVIPDTTMCLAPGLEANHRSADLDIALNTGCPGCSRAVSSGLELRKVPVGGLTPEGKK